jgi:hypothetical protein
MKKLLIPIGIVFTLLILFVACSDDSYLQPQNQGTEINNSTQGKLQNADTTSTQPKPEIFVFSFQSVPTTPIGIIDSVTGEILVTVPDNTDIKDLAPTIGYKVVPVPPVFNSTMLTLSPPAIHLNYETEQQYLVSYNPPAPSSGNLPSQRTYTTYVVFPNDFLVRPLTDSAFVSIGSEFTIKGNFGGDKSEYAVELVNALSGKKITLLPKFKFHNSLTVTIPSGKPMLNHLGEYKVNVIRKTIRKTVEGTLIISNN